MQFLEMNIKNENISKFVTIKKLNGSEFDDYFHIEETIFRNQNRMKLFQELHQYHTGLQK